MGVQVLDRNAVPDRPPGWTESIDDFIAQRNVKYDKVRTISGGMSAYIWKLDGYVEQDGSRTHDAAVLKYGDTSFKGIPELAVPPERIIREAEVLSSPVIAKACESVPTVQVPRLLQQVDGGVIMSWGGEITLRMAYVKDKHLDAGTLGARLGEWIACVHLEGHENAAVRDWTNDFRDGLIQKKAKNMEPILRDRGYDEKVIQRAASLLLTPGPFKTLSLWDFRPGNTLLPSQMDHGEIPIPTIVDLECSSYGDPAFDIHLWFADVLLLEWKHGSERGLLTSFLQSYREHAGPRIVTEEFVCRVAVATGAILLYLLPVQSWECTDEKDVEYWRAMAVEYIVAGGKGDMEWLKGSGLGGLLDRGSRL